MSDPRPPRHRLPEAAALVVVGGILLAPALILVILPVLIDLFSRRGRPIAGSEATMHSRGDV